MYRMICAIEIKISKHGGGQRQHTESNPVLVVRNHFRSTSSVKVSLAKTSVSRSLIENMESSRLKWKSPGWLTYIKWNSFNDDNDWWWYLFRCLIGNGNAINSWQPFNFPSLLSATQHLRIPNVGMLIRCCKWVLHNGLMLISFSSS